MTNNPLWARTPHTETAGLAGFTGNTPADRALAAGFNGGSVTESILHAWDWSSVPMVNMSNSSGVHYALGYHEEIVKAFDWNNAIGLGIMFWTSAAGATVANYGVAGPLPAVEPNTVLTYPCEGSSGTATGSTMEIDNLYPGYPGNFAGPPILVQTSPSSKIKLTSASLTNADRAEIPYYFALVNPESDPKHVLKPYQALVVPQSNLMANTRYNANITGTVNGMPFSRNFTFKTGTGSDPDSWASYRSAN